MLTAHRSSASKSNAQSKGSFPCTAAISAIDFPSKILFSGLVTLDATMFSQPTSSEIFSKSLPVSMRLLICARNEGFLKFSLSASSPPSWHSGGRM